MMSQPKQALLALIALVASVLPAGALTITVLADEATFDSLAPSLQEQTFAGVIYETRTISGPLSSSSATVETGPILPGLTLQSSGPGGLFIFGQEFVYNSQAVVAPNEYEESLDLVFGTGQTAVGLGLFSVYYTSSLTVSLYNENDQFIVSLTSSFPGAYESPLRTGAFMGFIVDGATIHRINVSSLGGMAEGVDRIKFAPTAAVPDASATLWLLAGALTSAALVRRRRTN